LLKCCKQVAERHDQALWPENSTCKSAQIVADFPLVKPKSVNRALVNDSNCAIKHGHLGRWQQNRRKAVIRLSDGTGAIHMTKDTSSGITRRGLLGAFAATAITAAPTYSNAAGFLRGAGDIRRIGMHSGRTGERLNTIYWIEGEYIAEAVREINIHMRDWRTGEAIQMDLRTIDIMSAALNLMDTTEPYLLLSGYRSAQTNNMLRSSNRGVARNSLHVQGQAADLRLTSRSTTQMANAAIACRAGGVGRYGRSNFVHMDCGPIRTWRG